MLGVARWDSIGILVPIVGNEVVVCSQIAL